MIGAMARQIAGRVHVAESNRTLLRECWRALAKDARHTNTPEYIAARKEFYHLALAEHKANGDLVRHFRF